MKKVKLYKIEHENVMVADHRDFFQFQSMNMRDLQPICNSNDIAAPMGSSVLELSAPIERVRFENGGEQLIAIHPRDREKILLFVERQEINELEGRLESSNKVLSNQYTELNLIRSAKLLTRVKWLFTGVS